MRQLHIVQADQRYDKLALERAARSHRRISTWIVPKSSVIGDTVIIYIAGYGFFATARISSTPVRRRDWKRRFGSALGSVSLIEPPISVSAIQRHIPKLKWANYPRSIHTPPATVATAALSLIKHRRQSHIPDLDEKSLLGANLGELRQVALMTARSRVPGIEAVTIHRARSRAIHLYVLKRADGRCEACNASAPFLKPDGSSYLEPHHVTRLADEGPDHPAKVIALCPNCHRRAHSSRDKEAFNGRLKQVLARLWRRGR